MTLIDHQSLNESEPIRWRRRVGGRLKEFDPRGLDPGEVFEPKRKTAARGRPGRHIPVQPWSSIEACRPALESGLEHDLLRRLDRPGVSRRLVPQPLSVTLPGVGERTPDLLQITETGFTLWQCKPEIKVDDEFLAECDEMRAAAETVGWGFVLFTGMPTVERLNLMWLNGFRVSRPWHQKCVGPIVAAASHEDACLDDLFALDDGGGETISTTWHLLWTGELITDLSVTLRSVTQVRHR